MGFPGVSLGPSIITGWYSAIISLETTFWMAIGTSVNYYIITPALFWGGVTRWPAGLNLYEEKSGDMYVFDGPNKTTGAIGLSGSVFLTMEGICFTLLGVIVESLDEFGPLLWRSFKNKLEENRRASMGRSALLNPDEDDLSSQTTKKSGKVPGEVPVWVGVIGCLVCGAAFLLVVAKMSPHDGDWLPWWGTLFVLIFGTLATIGLAALLATTAQSMALPSSMTVQVLFGFIMPGQGRSNILAAAINNAVVAQSLSLLTDYKMAQLMGVTPIVMMMTQLIGTGVGVVASVAVFYTVLQWNKEGIIHLGQGDTPNLGAEGTHFLAQMFGELGISKLVGDNKTLLVWTIICLIIGLTMPPIRRRVPEKWRPYVPNTILIGLTAFSPSLCFSVVTALIVAYIYQWHLKRRNRVWYDKYQMVSTSGMLMGVGIGGIVIFFVTALGGVTPVNLGGPIMDGCTYHPPNTPTY
mmetsp:Transcript_40875/g.88444  ORF Transcript_40875/g.88444 Transcript_40875/m.88444 type:complete len:466 (+) Transcript_40875:395-1792(+)